MRMCPLCEASRREAKRSEAPGGRRRDARPFTSMRGRRRQRRRPARRRQGRAGHGRRRKRAPPRTRHAGAPTRLARGRACVRSASGAGGRSPWSTACTPPRPWTAWPSAPRRAASCAGRTHGRLSYVDALYASARIKSNASNGHELAAHARAGASLEGTSVDRDHGAEPLPVVAAQCGGSESPPHRGGAAHASRGRRRGGRGGAHHHGRPGRPCSTRRAAPRGSLAILAAASLARRHAPLAATRCVGSALLERPRSRPRATCLDDLLPQMVKRGLAIADRAAASLVCPRGPTPPRRRVAAECARRADALSPTTGTALSRRGPCKWPTPSTTTWTSCSAAPTR